MGFGPYFLSMGCGLQNGLCSAWSGNVIRTTHHTGTATDLGLALGRMLSVFLRNGMSIKSYGTDDWEDHGMNRWKATLMSTLLAGFIAGGYVGSFTFNSIGLHTLFLPATFQCCLAIAHGLYVHIHKEEVAQAVAVEEGFQRQLSGASSVGFHKQLSGASSLAPLDHQDHVAYDRMLNADGFMMQHSNFQQPNADNRPVEKPKWKGIRHVQSYERLVAVKFR